MEESAQQIIEEILEDIQTLKTDIRRSRQLLGSKQHILKRQLQTGQISRLYFDIEMQNIQRHKIKLNDYALELQKHRTMALHKLRSLK